MMKKFIVIFGALLTIFAGCSTKRYVTSKESFKSTTDQIQNDLGNWGFSIVGEKTETKNEMAVSDVSYTASSGYGSAMKNNYWTYGEYSFADSNNNEVTYTLKYKEGVDFVQVVEVIGCAAKKNFDEICGQNGVVKSNINFMNNNPDAWIEVSDPGATAGLAVGLSSVVVFIVLLVILL